MSVIKLKQAYKFLLVMIAGLVIFLLDYYELNNDLINEIILLVVSLIKSVYFIYFVFDRIKETARKEFNFKEHFMFIIVSILLIIVSYSVDYYCLFRINANAFLGIIPKQNILTEFITFFYYSISVFTTAGFGDIKPNSTTSQILVSAELMIAFFFTILIIANISHIRDSYNQEKNN